ncbi:hypothetical protein CFB46_12100 [Burkholderia sp. HI2761]|uniref:DUF6173 family protein n=1 Tax=unclassified Burkholderia TaxID=2613784 RepID=UPI000B7A758F|nr:MULTISPECIES: DUF6173 family protein [unclassified Burkholderia]MPV55871.1 hypothetical protein [Burkholderia sp. BE24]OXJ27452.1 hypothetical protein CFB46_12100 [Burkholderia sp. HI2761]
MQPQNDVIRTALEDYKLPTIRTAHEAAFDTIVSQVRDFEAALADSEAVGGMLASFGQTVTLQITHISRAGQFLCFDGVTNEGDVARLVQHYTQSSLLLVKLTVPTKPNPIGFTAQ